MWKRTLAKNVKVTPMMATKFLEINTFEGQRAMQEFIVNAYAQLMKIGQFNTGHIVTATFGTLRFLMNGQHQCGACIKAGAEFDALVEEFVCETKADVWHLYGTYDVNKNRSESNLLTAARGFLPDDLKAMPHRMLRMCSSVFLYAQGKRPNFSEKPFSKVEKIDLLIRYQKEVHLIKKYWDIANESGLNLYLGTVVAIVLTHKINPSRSSAFWEKVISGIELKKDSPEHKLHKSLMAGQYNIIPMGKTNSAQRQSAIYNYCIAWYNTWLTKAPRTSVKVGSIKGVLDIVKESDI